MFTQQAGKDANGGGGAAEFHEVTRKDAEHRLQAELDRLLATADPSKQAQIRAEYNGFFRLFDRYLRDSNRAVDWNKIEKLPDGAVKKIIKY